MASATARPTFSFHLHTPNSQPSPTRSRTHLTISSSHHHLQKHQVTSSLNLSKLQFTTTLVKCIDVSQEDKPISEDPPNLTSTDSTDSMDAISGSVEVDAYEKRRMEEQFAVLNTGIYECRSCGYLYNEASGDPSYPIPPGMTFGKLPEDWRCPTCGAAQSFFQSKSVEIAGFAQNQQFGLGGNTLTGGQKLIIIYGSLLAFFVLFLSGYFLQ